jgi:ElaB/YqjD/DUF883 family membrane-anchored ribosome-binding protein
VKKKWYDYFVVTETPGADTKESPAKPAAAKTVSKGTPKRASELAADTVSEARFARPVSDPTAFAEIYDAARIAAPAHGYTILKVAEMLGSEHLRDQPAEVKKRSILVALDAAGVSVDSIVEDAVQRDRALDTYEKVLEKLLVDTRTKAETENQQLNAEIEKQIAELRKRIGENQQRVREEEASLAAWREQKHAEEKRIADAVQHFVSENPISTAAPSTPPGGDHVR